MSHRHPLWLLIALVPVTGLAGPFGLEKGMTLQQIGGSPAQVAPGKYKLSTVPKPHSAFESYIVEIGPTTGLCWIKAIGKTITTSVYGGELQVAFKDLKGKLDQTYGNAELVDRLMPGSIWSEPKDWMMSLLKRERHLFAVWSAKSGANLPADLTSVGITVSATSMNTGWVSVEYSFTNEKECDQDVSKAEDKAL